MEHAMFEVLGWITRRALKQAANRKAGVTVEPVPYDNFRGWELQLTAYEAYGIIFYHIWDRYVCATSSEDL